MAALASWLFNPIRLSGLLGIFFLVVPGTAAGFAMLAAHAGWSVGLPMVSPATHAMLQLYGYFIILIWGFLMHGLPGMLGADLATTRQIRWAMAALAIALVLRWFGDAASLPRVASTALILAAVAITAGSLLLTWAAIRGKHDWRTTPFPILIAGLLTTPVAAAVYLLGTRDSEQAGAHLVLWGSVVPIILAMGFRMFPAMLRFQHPNPRLFSAAALVWFSGVYGHALTHLGVAGVRVFEVLTLIGAMGFTVSLGIFAARRQPGKGMAVPPQVDASTRWHIQAAFGFLLLSAVLRNALGWDLLPGTAFYWDDAARHLTAIGFGLISVAGLTERVFPTFLRARPASARCMNLVLGLLVLGVLLRLAEPFMPQTRMLVRFAAVCLYSGITLYAGHLLAAMLARERRLETRIDIGEKAADNSVANSQRVRSKTKREPAGPNLRAARERIQA